MGSCKMVLKQVLSCVNKMQKNHLQGSWDCLGENSKKWWDGERMVDRKNCQELGITLLSWDTHLGYR